MASEPNTGRRLDRRKALAVGLAILGPAWRAKRAGASEVSDDEAASTGYLNAMTPTLGGRQFWADEWCYQDWHIQRNVFTDHCRLLDGRNVRHAWGSFDECKNKLRRICTERNLPPMRGPAVVVLHGLFRSAASMRHMARYLSDQGRYTVFNINYPTTRGSVADHAGSLAKVIDSLEGIDEINFVAHSLGNLVVRHYLADHSRPGLTPDARIKRMVMLGPPNQGAQMAAALGKYKLFHLVAGKSASGLGRDWTQLEKNLATPSFPFGILAGGSEQPTGYNPLLEGDNDLVVSVATTRLAGAADFAVLPVLHTLMMDDPQVQAYTLRFLQHGYFVNDHARQPIVAHAAPQDS